MADMMTLPDPRTPETSYLLAILKELQALRGLVEALSAKEPVSAIAETTAKKRKGQEAQ